MPGIESSMQVDAREGRRLEVDVILGTPMRMAREFGMDVPTLATVYALTVACLLYTSPSPRDGLLSRMPSSA